MTNKTLRNRLKKQDACADAVEWIGDRDLEAAWKECPRGDWMLWLAGRGGIDRRLLVKVACECAELALPIYENEYPEDKRVRNCIAVTLKWVAGKATIEEVRKARNAASDAAAASDDAHASDAAYAADAAAYPAAGNAAAGYAGYAAAAAADAADAYAAAARIKMQKRTASVVRQAIPFKEIEKVLAFPPRL